MMGQLRKHSKVHFVKLCSFIQRALSSDMGVVIGSDGGQLLWILVANSGLATPSLEGANGKRKVAWPLAWVWPEGQSFFLRSPTLPTLVSCQSIWLSGCWLWHGWSGDNFDSDGVEGCTMWRCTLRNLAQVATMCYGRARGWISHEPVLTARYAANLSGPKGQNFLYSPLPIVPPISWAWWNQCTMEPIYVCVCQTCTVSKFGYMSEKIYCTEPLKAMRNMATVVLPITT